MAPTWLKLVVPAMLVVCFVPYTRSKDLVDKDLKGKDILEVRCPEPSSQKKICPAYCPKDSRPDKVNPSSAWAVACVCCDVVGNGMTLRTGIKGGRNKTEFKLEMQPKPVKPADVRKEDRDRLLKELEDLKNKKILPRQEFEWWKLKVEQTDKHLLTKDEEELLVQLFVDCGVPLNNAILLVHPVVADQALPKPKGSPDFNRRSKWWINPIDMVNNLRNTLQNMQIGRRDIEQTTYA